MPNRLLKESIATSPEINQLSWEEEVLFYRLLTRLDDFGRYHGEPSIIRAACFPQRLSRVSERAVTKMLDRLQVIGLIGFYESGGRPYIQALTWEKHQRVRAKMSRFPEPPQDAVTRWQMSADCGETRTDAPVLVLESHRTRKSPESESIAPKTPARRAADPVFDALAVLQNLDPRHIPPDQGKLIGRVQREIVGMSPDVTAEEIVRRKEHWPRLFPARNGQAPPTFTIFALAKFWGQLDNPSWASAEAYAQGLEQVMDTVSWGEG